MTGGNILSIGENEYGIVPRAVQTVFKTLQVCDLEIRKVYLMIVLESNRLSCEYFSIIFRNL
jgi:hypothetical protein